MYLIKQVIWSKLSYFFERFYIEMKLKVSQKGLKIIICLGITALTLLICIIFNNVRYETNDDRALNLISAGA